MKTYEKTQENSTENLIKKIEELEAKNEQLEYKIQWLMEQFRLSKHKQFGVSSEQNNVEQISLFNEVETFADLTMPEPEITKVKAYSRNLYVMCSMFIHAETVRKTPNMYQW